MKKTFALLLALLLVFSLAACTSGSNEPAADPEPAPVIKEAEDGGVFDGRIGETIRTYFYDFKVTDAYLCDDYHGFTPQDGNVLLVVKMDKARRDFIPAPAELKKAIAIGHRHGVFVNVFVGGDAGADETVYARLLELGADAFGTERPDAFFAWVSGSGKAQ